MNESINKLNAALLTFSESADALLEVWSAVESDEQTNTQMRVLEMLQEQYPLGKNLKELVEDIAVWQTNVLIASKTHAPE
jgi:hypothetical protein